MGFLRQWIHRGWAVQEFLANGAAARLQLECLPSYASELNSDEGVWNPLKRNELNNRSYWDLDEVRWELGLAIRWLRRKRPLLRSCVTHCGCG